MVKQVLGRGLGALLGGNSPVKPASPFVAPSAPVAEPPSAAPAPPAPAAAGDVAEQVRLIPLARVHPCPFQPRKDFPPEAIRELADSIKEQGIVQPLLVREKDGGFELIAGERRWRAAQLLGLAEVPVIVRVADDLTVLELALIENLQRENLNPMEEANGYAQLINQFNLTQESAAAKVGKSRAAVANALRLLKLAPEVQVFLRDGHLSVGHMKVILALSNQEEQKLAAQRIIKDDLSVRQTEELVAFMQQGRGAGGKKSASAIRDAHVVDLENRLRDKFGTKVALRYRKGKGSVEIRFFSDDDLERVLGIVGVRLD